jgi:hypothetical protein
VHDRCRPGPPSKLRGGDDAHPSPADAFGGERPQMIARGREGLGRRRGRIDYSRKLTHRVAESAAECASTT